MLLTVYIRNLSHITPQIKIDALLSEDKIRLYHLHTEGWEAIVQDNLEKEEELGNCPEGCEVLN